MKIGIIGAGFVARNITEVAIKNGHEVMISNSRDPKTLFTTVFSLGCKAGTAEQAAAFGDIVIAAVPMSSYKSIPVGPLAGKVVIDTDNYYPDRDGSIPELDNHQTTTSELLARHLPQSNIVKAFNAIIITQLPTDGRPSGDPARRALPIAGNDPVAKKLVSDLHDQFGYDIVDAGPLAEGRRFERDTPAYCIRSNKAEMTALLAKA